MKRNSIKLRTHCKAYRLHPDDPIYRKWITEFLFEGIRMDAGKKDITSSLLFPKNKKASALIIAKERGIIAGIEELKYFLERKKIKFKIFRKDGADVKKGDKILELKSDIKNILKAERVILNFLSRMSGIATFTKKLVRKVKKVNSNILITPTRKTFWGWLDKKACVIGGGGTHRLTLDDAVLIKPNHIKALGGFEKLKLTKHRYGISFIEIEVNTVKQALKTAEIFSKYNPRLPFYIMFDNMKPKNIASAINKIKKIDLCNKILFEASGGINEKNIKKYAKTEVDVISMGCLTVKTHSLDMSLNII